MEKALSDNNLESITASLSDFRRKVMEDVEKKMDELLNSLKEKAKAIEDGRIEFPLDLNKELKELEKLKKEDPLRFIDRYETVNREVDTALPKIVKGKLTKLQKEFPKYEKYGVKIKDYEEKMSKIVGEMGKEEYEKILREIADLEKNFETYLKEFVNQKIEEVKKRVSKYSKSKAEIMAEKMKKHAAKGEFLKALEVVDEANDYIAEYKLKVNDFNKKALELKELIKYGISIGLKLDKEVMELKSALKSIEDIEAATEELKRIEKVIREKIENLKPEINVSIEDMDVSDRGISAKVLVENKGNTDAVNVMIVMKGAGETEKPVKIGKVPKGGKQSIDVLMLKGEGDEIEIEAKFYRFDGKEFSWSGKKEIEKESKGFHMEKAKEKVKCAFCRGTILKGLDIVVCDKCGATYHLPCAKRAGKCVKCGNPFHFE